MPTTSWGAPGAFRPEINETAFDLRFPRAVAGEAYDRYARAVWRQSQRWIARHWPRLCTAGAAREDVHDALRQIASIDLTRRLYPQEERLLGEIVQHAWLAEQRASIVPEVPSFLRTPAPDRAVTRAAPAFR